MASSPSNSFSEPAKIEQVITEFFAKSLHIILESRSPYVSSRNYSGDHFTSSPSSSSSSSSGRPRDKWFNLALRDCPAALENFDLWRQSNLDPLIVDVILTRRRPKDLILNCYGSGFSPRNKSEKIVERWVVQYENRKSSNNTLRELHVGSRRSAGASSHSSEIPLMYRKIYKRTTVLLRSLYVMVRLLPAYKLFRDLNSSARIHSIGLSHKISSLVEPFTRAEEVEMNQFGFMPVDTSCGRLSLSVSYLPVLEDVSSEPSTPLSAQFIPDYVGSPMTDPLKRLHSLPSGGSLPTYVSFTRRHSWSNDDGATPSVSPSPSPTYSESRALHCNPNLPLPPRVHQPDYIPTTCPVTQNALLAHRKNTSFDECWPSPPFSPSSSPSPPSHLPGSQLRNALLRSESAPVSIPMLRVGGSGGFCNQALLPPPSQKSGKPGCSSQADILRVQVTTASASQTSSPESKLQLKKGSGGFQAGLTLQKILYSGKDEVGNLSGQRMSSCTSPRIPSRSSSRFSLPDEFDESEFTYPFAVDDEDLTDSCRIEPSDGEDHTSEILASGGSRPVRRSPDAVIGAFVRMFKNAAPLQRDFSNSIVPSQAIMEEACSQEIQHKINKEDGTEKLDNIASSSAIAASGLFKSRTAADALEELKNYRVMKELLLSKGGPQSLDDVEFAEKSASKTPTEF